MILPEVAYSSFISVGTLTCLQQ